MRQLSQEGQCVVADLAQRHGFTQQAVEHMMYAVLNGNGTMAQFNHPEFAGSGQWMRGGMMMLGDMFNHSLKGRVDSLCCDLSDILAANILYSERHEHLVKESRLPGLIVLLVSVEGQLAHFPEVELVFPGDIGSAGHHRGLSLIGVEPCLGSGRVLSEVVPYRAYHLSPAVSPLVRVNLCRRIAGEQGYLRPRRVYDY